MVPRYQIIQLTMLYKNSRFTLNHPPPTPTTQTFEALPGKVESLTMHNLTRSNMKEEKGLPEPPSPKFFYFFTKIKNKLKNNDKISSRCAECFAPA
jgi:hypothetical protein